MRVTLESELDLLIALEATKRRIRAVGLATACGIWFAAAGVWLLLFVIVDHATASGVPHPLRRTTNILFWLSSLTWFALAGVLPFTRRINDLYVARLIEKTHPEFRNALVDAIQITRHEELPGSIRAAVIERAARDVTCVEPARSVPTRRLHRTVRAVVAVVTIFLLYGLMAPKAIWPSLLRGMGLDLRAPTYTRILNLTPADGTSVLTGRPVAFAAKLAGRRPTSIFVRFSFDDGATWSDGQQLPLAPPVSDEPDPQWRAIKAGQDIRQSMRWQVVAGDTTSETRQLEVRPLPAITDVRVEYAYPASSGLPPTTRPGGDIEAPRGTQATIRAATNVPAFKPALTLGRPPDERTRVLDTPAEGTRELRIPLMVTADDEYRIEFRDGHGEPNADPVRYTIRARAETPPLASAPSPEIEETADEVASKPAPAESRPAQVALVAGEKLKRGPPAGTPTSAAASQAGEGEYVASQSPADSQPSTRAAVVEADEDMERREQTAKEKEFEKEHQHELEALAKHLLDKAPSQPGGEAPQGSQPSQADAPESDAALANGSSEAGQPGEAEGAGQGGDSAGAGQGGESAASAQNGESEGTGQPDEGQAQPGNGDAGGQGGEGEGKTGDGSASGEDAEGEGQGQSGNGTSSGQAADSAANSNGQGSSGESEGEGQAQGESGREASTSSSQGSQGQGSNQGKGKGQGNSKGEGDSSAGQPTEATSEQPSGSGGSGQGGSGGESSTPTTNPGEGSGAGASDSPGEGQGSPRRVATVGQARQAIDALERDLRKGEVDRELLDQLGWDVQTAERFVEAYKRSGMRQQPTADTATTNPAPRQVHAALASRRPERVILSEGPPAADAHSLIDTGTRPADDTHDLMQVGHQRVPPRYKAILDAYYRTLASRPSP